MGVGISVTTSLQKTNITKLIAMGRIIAYVFVLLLFVISYNGCFKKKTEPLSLRLKGDTTIALSQHNMLTAAEIEEGWHLLFDGTTTKGWRGFRNDSAVGWTVEEGNLVAPGKGDGVSGDIITVDQFENFELSLEWKISPEGNSGIMYHVLEDNFEAAWATGPEYQIIDDIGFPEKLEPWQTTGANYAMHPPVNAKVKPVGEYNSSRIVIKSTHVEHWLNDTKVVEFEQWSDDWYTRVKEGKWKDYPKYGLAKKGHIALQDHGKKIWFRNIKIRIIE